MMRMTRENITKGLDVLGACIAVITMISSLFVTGLFGMGDYGTLFNYPICILLILYVVLYCIINKGTNMKKDKIFLCIMLYFGVQILTIIVRDNKIMNLKIFILIAVQWLILFPYMRNHKHFMMKLLAVINLLIFIITMISILYCFLWNHPVSNFMERECGLYENPNTGAAIAMISVGLSALLFAQGKTIYRIFLVCNMLVQICMMRLCMSRASFIALLVFVFIATLTYSFLRYRKWLVIVRNIALVLLSTIILYQNVAPMLYHARSMILYQPQESKKDNIARPNTEVWEPVRDESKEESSDNYRVLLLKSGILAFLNQPLIGSGLYGLPAAVNAQSKQPLDGLQGGGVHNAYLQLLVANGVTGFAALGMIVVLLLMKLIRQRKILLNERDNVKILQYSVFFAFFVSFMVYGLFEAVIVLSSSFIANCFVMLLGGMQTDVKKYSDN